MSSRSAYLRKLICKLMYAPRSHTALHAAATAVCTQVYNTGYIAPLFCTPRALQEYLAVGWARALSARGTPQWSMAAWKDATTINIQSRERGHSSRLLSVHFAPRWFAPCAQCSLLFCLVLEPPWKPTTTPSTPPTPRLIMERASRFHY